MLNNAVEMELENLLGFELWLSSWVPIAVVGQARMSCECPLAFYLMQAFGTTAIVGSDRIVVGDLFAAHTDLSQALILCLDDERGNREPITSKQAKAALNAARSLITAAKKEKR